jgi:hypothetical protein
MKTLISSIVLLGIGFAAGYAVAKLGGSNPLAAIPNPIAAIKGEDQYEVLYEGQPGVKFIGSYGFWNFNGTTPMRTEVVQATLPHKVTFTAPKGVIAVATAQNINVKIYRNGVECKESPLWTGSGVPSTARCAPN